ncbi:MAG: hypothetical protein H7202_04190 [Pedobacter sp.]|nr:hypothetical protein [Pedobacter sp.]
MQQPFDLEVGSLQYAIFPEGNDTYIVFKDGKEYLQIQKDAASQWIKFDKETGLPQFEPDDEVNELGKQIENYKEEPELGDDEEIDS